MNKTQNLNEQALRKMIRTHRWILGMARHWLVILLTLLFLYSSLPFVAPVLMEAHFDQAANVIYTFYSPMCHQFAFRSFFLFGDQVAYPRKAAGSSLVSFDEYAARDAHFQGVDLSKWSADLQLSARSFKGDSAMGYKVALCERDVAIYSMMFLAGLLFSRVRRWLRPAPVWLYLILGLGPIGLDGFSQLFGYAPFQFWPVRETLPGFRVLTGALFGLMNVWLAFPYLESSMRETIETVGEKLELEKRRLAAVQSGD